MRLPHRSEVEFIIVIVGSTVVCRQTGVVLQKELRVLHHLDWQQKIQEEKMTVDLT